MSTLHAHQLGSYTCDFIPTALQQVRSTLSSDISSVESLLSPVSSFNLGVCEVLEVTAFWESELIGMLPVALLPDSASGLFLFFLLPVGPRLVMCSLELQTGGKGQSSLVESEVGVFED